MAKQGEIKGQDLQALPVMWILQGLHGPNTTCLFFWRFTFQHPLFSIRIPFLCQDSFIQECELLREDSLEDDLIIEGEYLSETSMIEDWGWSEHLGVDEVLIIVA